MENRISDSFVSVFDRAPTEKELSHIKSNLPNEIYELVERWGSDDTEVRDKTFVWIRENKEIFE